MYLGCEFPSGGVTTVLQKVQTEEFGFCSSSSSSFPPPFHATLGTHCTEVWAYDVDDLWDVWVAKSVKPGRSNGFWVWIQCVYLKVSIANFLLFIGQTKCESTDTAKKCGIQRNPRLAPVVNDGSVKWHKESTRAEDLLGRAQLLTAWASYCGKEKDHWRNVSLFLIALRAVQANLRERELMELGQESFYPRML